MHMYDLYVNPFEEKNDEITFQQAKQDVLSALSVLGSEYKGLLETAFENNWIDSNPMPNKRGGAYSMGVYGVHPFVLMSFVNSKRDVSTIAHELGHSIHTYYSNENQNVQVSTNTENGSSIVNNTQTLENQQEQNIANNQQNENKSSVNAQKTENKNTLDNQVQENQNSVNSSNKLNNSNNENI